MAAERLELELAALRRLAGYICGCGETTPNKIVENTPKEDGTFELIESHPCDGCIKQHGGLSVNTTILGQDPAEQIYLD